MYSKTRIAVGGSVLELVLLFAISGCQYRNGSTVLSQEQGRRVEVLIRSQYDIPPDYRVTLGRTTRSEVPGYYALPVSFSHDGKHVNFNFLVSRDGKRLARLQEYDLTNEPWRSIHMVPHQARGAADAKVTVVVFDDLACVFCARLYTELFPETLKRFHNSVRIIYKEYPLPIHPWAVHAAVNAACLAQQNTEAYWDYVGRIHAHFADFSGDVQHLPLSLNKLDEVAKDEISVNQQVLDQCIKKQDDHEIRASIAEGDKLGVESTPTIFVNGEKLVGATRIEWLWAAIDRAIKSQGDVPHT